MMHEADIVCEARRENLGVLLQFVEQACHRAALHEDASFAVRLATEEACTNVIMHAYADRTPGSLAVRFASGDDRVVVTIEDQGRPFEPSSVSTPVLNAAAEERPLGGLGWHLMKQMMDEVTHEYDAARGNRLTLVKYLSAAATSQEKTWKSP